jgi:hypothetical protein
MRVIVAPARSLVAGYGPMDSYLSYSQNRANSFDHPPILVCGDSESALARGRAAVSMSGLRLADAVPLAQAAERMTRQAAASALWIELGGGAGESGAQELLEHVRSDVAEGRYGAVLAVTSEALDAVADHALSAAFEVVVDGDEAQRAAALAIAISAARRADRLSDMTADKNAARLRQLSDEVSRIAATLARLSTGPGAGTLPRSCLRIPRGTCFSICFKPKAPICAFRYRAFALLPRYQRPPRCAG